MMRNWGFTGEMAARGSARSLIRSKRKEIGMMKPRWVLGLVLLLIGLATFGCAGMGTYQSSGGDASAMMGCNGDIPSHYGTGCHPGH